MRRLPEGWHLVRLGEISDVKGGKRLPKGIPLVSHNTGFPYIRVSDMNENGIVLSDIHYVPADVAPRIKSYRVKAGDLYLVVVGATIGKVGRVPFELNNANLTENADKITNIKADSEFLLNVLRSQIVQSTIEKLKTQNAQPKLALERLRNFQIPLPPLPEQRKIAAILSTWDEAITLTGQLIAALTRRKKALMQLLLTGAVRFPEFDGEWEEVELSDIAEVIMGQSPPSEGYNSEGVGLPLIQGNADIKARKTAPRSFTSIITKQCQIDDTILSVRAPVGEVARSLQEACIGRGVAAIRATKSNPDFLYQLMVFTEQAWQEFAQGSTFTAINSTDIKAFALEVPILVDEQVQIAYLLNLCDMELNIWKVYETIYKSKSAG